MVNSAKKIQRLRESQDPSALNESIEESESDTEMDTKLDEDQEDFISKGIDSMNLETFTDSEIKVTKNPSNPLESGEIPDYINSNNDINRSIEHLTFVLDPLRAKDRTSKTKVFDISIIQSNFEEWKEYLLQGFNILIYGPGSKRIVLEKFYEFLSKDDPPRIIINGFHPLITVRKVLEEI